MHIVIVLMALLVVLTIFACLIAKDVIGITIAACILAIAIIAVGYLRYSEDDDHLRARQADRMLKLASETLPYMRNGLSSESAQSVCNLLLPDMLAVSVAITDTEKILGFAGFESEYHRPGQPIRTRATHAVIEEGMLHVEEVYEGMTDDRHDCNLRAAIIAPLKVRDTVCGTIKFYYRQPKKITETRIAMAEGLAELLSTQLSLAELDAQAERAARLELRALQAQINPHFLFNTINTITSLVRTDPMKARDLLREFAAFYRGTLENSSDFIPLFREVEQTSRYLNLEIARFGDDRIQVECKIKSEIADIPVPSFIIQPIVENSIVHGLRSEDTLHIDIEATFEGNDVIIIISDDGEGIPEDKLPFLLEPKEGGTGIALNNVDSRLKATFGDESGLEVTSTLGVGTYVRLFMPGALNMEGK